MERFKCEFCGVEFDKWQQKANHIRWNHKTEEYLNSFKENQKNNVNLIYDKKLGELLSIEVQCNCCKKYFLIEERERLFPKKEKYYCSRSCSNSHSWSNENKVKQSISVRNSEKVKTARIKRYGVETKIKKICKYCNSEFQVIKSNKQRVFCNIKCKNKYYYNNKSDKQKYYSLTQFKFALNQFPEEFDFNLIKEYGWYQAKNHGDNLQGISRDHIYSIFDGFKNNIDPLILAHPANCQLLCHNINLSVKNRKSEISLEDLIKKINKWEEKYGKYYKEI